MIQPLKLGFDIKITTKPDEVLKMVLEAIRDKLNANLTKVALKVQDDIRNKIVKHIFRKSNEYEALVNGPLDAHFGIPQGEAIGRLDAILNTLADTVVVETRRITVRAKTLTGGLTVKAFPKDFATILALPEASVVTEKGQSLPWLEWLLLEGDAIIITEYAIKFGANVNSRSGGAIMVEKKAGIWRVPPGVSGTRNDNWITRAVDDSAGFIEKAIEASVQRHMGAIT